MATLVGTDTPDLLTGGAGHDVLYGYAGDPPTPDPLGGTPDDDDTLDGGAGNDALYAGDGDDQLIGGVGNDTLDGGEGSDTYLVSGTGDGYDLYQDSGGAGIDRITALLDGTRIGLIGFGPASGIEEITADGHADVSIAGQASHDIFDFTGTTLFGIDHIDLGAGNDTLTGSAIADTIIGNAGNDTLDGAGGGDTYRVDGSGHGYDTYQDSGGDGIDRIVALGDGTRIGMTGFGPASGIEEITADGHADVSIAGQASHDIFDFTGTTLSGIDRIDTGAGNDTLTGSAIADTILGNAGNDTLDGAGGGDTYRVDGTGHGFDAYQDSGGDGIDRIVALGDGTRIGLISFGPTSGIEEITADGHADVSIAGQASHDIFDFTGTTLTGIDRIDTGAGNDTLIGSAIADTIIGDAGNDTLDGAGGGDTYLVDGSGHGYDTYQDSGGDGIDRIVALGDGTRIGLISFDLASGIEELTADGHADVSIAGQASHDIFDFTGIALTGIDHIDLGAGNDTLTGSAIADTIIGNAGNDTLDGAGGGDTYLVDGSGHGYDTCQDSGGDGIDRIVALSDGTRIGLTGFGPTSGIEEITADGHADVSIAARASHDVFDFAGTTLTGIGIVDMGAGNDRVVTATGVGPTLYDGGAGNDRLTVALTAAQADDPAVAAEIATFRDHLAGGLGGTPFVFATLGGSAVSFESLDILPVSGDDSLATDEDTALTAAAGALLANDLDLDPGDALTIVAVGPAAVGQAALNPDGTVTYDPDGQFENLAAGAEASDSFTYTVADTAGNQATATVVVTIAGRNDAPVAPPLAGEFSEGDAGVAIDLLAGASDVDLGDVLSAANVAQDVGASGRDLAGAFAVVGNTLSLDPALYADLAAGADETLVFSYDVTDGTAATPRTLTLTVTGVNTAPEADDAAVETTAGIAVDGQVTATDPDTGDQVSFALGDGPVGGSVAVAADGSFTYTPDVGFTGEDSFTVIATDLAGATDTATVTVAVAEQPGQLVTGDEVQVNTTTAGGQSRPAIAELADGRHIMVWDGLNSGQRAIYAQFLDDTGAKDGGQFIVNSNLVGSRAISTVVALDTVDPQTTTPGFVVAWQEGNPPDVWFQRYDLAGNRIGGEVVVNTAAADYQGHTALTALGDGRFVVAWTDRSGQDGDGSGLYFRIYDASGAPEAAAAQINVTTAGDQDLDTDPGIYAAVSRPMATLADGSFVITWTASGQDGDGLGVYARQFAADGTALTGEIPVNTATAGDQQAASLTALTDGGFIVVWQDGDGGTTTILAQRFDGAGQKVGGAFQVNTGSVPATSSPTVAGLTDGGFIVAWEASSVGTDGNSAIAARQYDAAGVAVTDEVQVNQVIAGRQYEPDIVARSDGGWAVAWSTPDGSAEGVAARVTWLDDGVPDDPEPLALDSLVATNVETSINGRVTATDATPGEVLSFAIMADATHGSVVMGADGTFSYAPDDGFAGSDSFHYVVTDFGGQQDTGIVSIDVAPVVDGHGDELVANSTTTGIQWRSNVGVLDDGGYVVVWDGNGTGDAHGIFAARFDAGGQPMTGEFRVNTYGAQAIQGLASVAGLVRASPDDPDPGFVVVWEDQDTGTLAEISAQRYDAAGNKVGSQFVINSTWPGFQGRPEVAALHNGTFVVTWEDLTIGDQYLQVMAADGTKIGSETRVNSYTSGIQGSQGDVTQPLAVLADGSFVIVWTSDYQDGNGRGMYGQMFTDSGAKIGGEFQINTLTTGDQEYGSVAALDSGGFVVTWLSDTDGDRSIRAQTFDDGANKVGSEIHVSTSPVNDWTFPVVAGVADGGFRVVWEGAGTDPDNSDGLLTRLFDRTGNAQSDEAPVPENTIGQQLRPSIAAAPDGNTVVSWSTYHYGDLDIAVRVLGTPGIAAKDITGGLGSDSLLGSPSDDTLAGGGGDDWLAGGSGDDRFIFGPGDGNDTIDDFAAGAGSEDVIDLTGFGFSGMADLAIGDTPDGALVDTGDGTLTLTGVSAASLHVDDFLF